MASDEQRSRLTALIDDELGGPDLFRQIFTIDKLLLGLFPQNPELADRWMNAPNRAFAGLTPLQLIHQSNRSGVAEVCAYLRGML